MSSYYGLAILLLWVFNFIILFILSKNLYVFIVGFIFSLIIVPLAALLDTIIEKREREQ